MKKATMMKQRLLRLKFLNLFMLAGIFAFSFLLCFPFLGTEEEYQEMRAGVPGSFLIKAGANFLAGLFLIIILVVLNLLVDFLANGRPDKRRILDVLFFGSAAALISSLTGNTIFFAMG